MATNIVKHEYNGFSIPQREEDGYVSLTKMAAAYSRKKVNDFLRLKQTKAYLSALSADTGIPVSDLITTKKGGDQKDLQGTWTHKEVAVKFAEWLSPDFEVWAKRSLVAQIEGPVSAPEPKKELSAELAESEAIANMVAGALSGAHLGSTPAESANLIAGAKLSVFGLRHPALRAELMEGHKLLAASTPTPSILLNPTTIGEELGMSGRAVNTLLVEFGLQTRVPKASQKKGEPKYRPTAEGQKYASNTLSTGYGGDKTTYQHIKWTQEVVEVLRDFMAIAVDS